MEWNGLCYKAAANTIVSPYYSKAEMTDGESEMSAGTKRSEGRAELGTTMSLTMSQRKSKLGVLNI